MGWFYRANSRAVARYAHHTGKPVGVYENSSALERGGFLADFLVLGVGGVCDDGVCVLGGC